MMRSPLAFLLVVLVGSAMAQGKEPSEDELRVAVIAFYDSGTESQRKTLAQCQSGNLKGPLCFNVLTIGVVEMEVQAFRKMDPCKVSKDQKGYFCTFTPVIRVSSSSNTASEGMGRMLSRSTTWLFHRTPIGVRAMPEQ